jgi:transcriptional regulator with XRE-family HTH domain
MFDLRRFRKENRLTQTELGKRIGYTHAYISNIENGKEDLSDNFLGKIEEAFSVDLTEYKSYNKKPVLGAIGAEYGTDWKVKYYDLLEKYTSLLEENKAYQTKEKSKVKLSDKHVSKP